MVDADSQLHRQLTGPSSLKRAGNMPERLRSCPNAPKRAQKREVSGMGGEGGGTWDMRTGSEATSPPTGL